MSKSNSIETPHSLLKRLRTERDAGDWRRLVDLYSPLIREWLSVYSVPSADVDDFIQDVFQTLVGDIESFEHNGRPGAFRRWLRVTLVNRLRGHWREVRNRRTLGGEQAERLLAELEDSDSDPNRLWERQHDQFIARRMLELIEPEFTRSTWLAFRRQVLDGEKAVDTARELGTTSNAVLISKSRVLRRFREEIHGLVDDT